MFLGALTVKSRILPRATGTEAGKAKLEAVSARLMVLMSNYGTKTAGRGV